MNNARHITARIWCRKYRNERRAVVREIELWREKNEASLSYALFGGRRVFTQAQISPCELHPRISGFEGEEEGGFPEERAKRKSAESRESRDALTVRRYNREAFTIDERERKLCATRARGVFGKYDFHFSLINVRAVSARARCVPSRTLNRIVQGRGVAYRGKL